MVPEDLKYSKEHEWVRTNGDSAEIVWNLCEALLCTGRGVEAVELFEEMQKLEILNVEVLTRTAEVLLENCDDADALKVLEQSLQLYPDQEILKPMIEIIKYKLLSDDQVENTEE